jgi:NDP-sugar pyrophosphorylase family protein
MRALVLAGGRGTRLAPYTISFPKPLVPIGEIPIIEIVLRQLRWHGVDEAVLSVGYLAHLIEAYFATRGGIDGLRISYLRESQPLGTAGPIGLLPADDKDLLVVNGDIMTTLDITSMVEFHRLHRPALTIAVHPRSVTIDLGVLDVDATSNVTAYREKPVLQYQCSMGVYLYSPIAARSVQAGDRLDFPDLVLRLLNARERVLAYKSDCYWLDIGRREDYERATAEFPNLRSLLLPDEEASPDTAPSGTLDLTASDASGVLTAVEESVQPAP